MKRINMRIKSAFLTALVLAVVVWVNAGNLNPPAGPVSSTMKDLATVEPRTPILSLPYTIGVPGSYYVAKDLTGVTGQHGIVIAASDVSLDLRGFTVRGVTGSLNGIHVAGPRSKIRIENGVSAGWGGDGINTLTSDKTSIIMFMTRDNDGSGVSTNGGTGVLYMQSNNNQGHGLVTGDKCICKDAECCGNGQDGIHTGSGCKIEDCVATGNGANGITAGAGSIVKICTVQSNGTDGIAATSGCTVSDCNARSNTGDGIEAANHCLVLNNNVSVNGTGIHVVLGSPPGGTRVESNNAAFNSTTNFDISSAGNLIVKNSSAGPGTGYTIAGGNDFGAIISLGGGGPFTIANAWANFDY